MLKAIREALPAHDIIYYADTAHLPYGDRAPDEIVRFATGISQYLMERGAAIVAVACNTSSALALQALRQRLSVPFVGMIDCGASAVARASASGRIGVMATVNTVRSRAYTEAIAGRRPGAVVVQQACPELVPLVERGELDGARVRRALREYQGPLMEAEVDSIRMAAPTIPSCTRPSARKWGWEWHWWIRPRGGQGGG